MRGTEVRVRGAEMQAALGTRPLRMSVWLLSDGGRRFRGLPAHPTPASEARGRAAFSGAGEITTLRNGSVSKMTRRGLPRAVQTACAAACPFSSGGLSGT